MDDFTKPGREARLSLDVTRRAFLRQASALGASGAALGSIAPAFAQARSPWSEAKQFPEPYSEVYGLSVGGKLYVFGGLDQGTTPRGLVYEYDAGADSWTKKKTMPRPVHHTSQAELGGKIYMFGGFAAGAASEGLGWKPSDAASEYDPTTDTWKELPPLPTPRGAPIAAALDGKLYVIGGG